MLPRIASLLLGFVLALAFLSPVQAQTAPAPNAAPPPAPIDAARATFERTLPNGMKVIVREDHRAPTVVHVVLYRVGSVDEAKGHTGISHVLEHMMFKGTERYPAGEFSRLVAQLGGRENAFTTSDYTGYFQQIGKQHLGEMMKLEADRMSNLVLAQKEFEQEVRVVMEERRLRTEDRAQALVYEQFRAQAFIASPVRQPVIGWFSDLQALTVDDLRHWYAQWYTPSNAIVVVVGDVSAEDVWKQAEATYGQVKAHALPTRKPLDEPEQRGLRRAWVKAPAENPYVTMGFHVPRLNDIERDTEPYALEVLAAVLDADENGRLTRNIVRGSRVANQVGAGYDSLTRGPTLFVLDGTPAEGHTTAEVEQALRDEVAKIASDGVAVEELERIKTQYVAGEIYKRDSIMAQAMEIGGLEMTGFTHRDADRILARIAAVTSEEVQAVAKKYFGSEDTLTIATLLPQPLPEGAPTGSQPPGGEKGGPIR
ncbi:MAG: insulinase family protein [Burkholderiaceae bacterium]|nr:insulinase family protein [Burkholderiaceae bacterium]